MNKHSAEYWREKYLEQKKLADDLQTRLDLMGSDKEIITLVNMYGKFTDEQKEAIHKLIEVLRSDSV